MSVKIENHLSEETNIEEEDEFFSSFIDSSFERSKILDQLSNQDSNDQYIELGNVVDATDEETDVFGMGLLFAQQSVVLDKTVLESENGTEFLKSFILQVVSAERYLSESNANHFPAVMKLLCKFLQRMKGFSSVQHFTTLQVLNTFVRQLYSKKFVDKVIQKHTACFYSTKYTLIVIARYCAYILSEYAEKPLSENVLHTIQFACKILNVILSGRKTTDAENQLEKTIPENLVAFSFSLKDTNTKEENTEPTPTSDIIQQLLLISDKSSVHSNVNITPVIIGKSSISALSFDKIVKQARSYLINNLSIGECVSSVINKTLSSKYEHVTHFTGMTLEIISLLSKPNVKVCKIEMQFLLQKLAAILSNQSVGKYSPDILRAISTLVLKMTQGIKDAKILIAYFLNGISTIFNEEGGAQKSMGIYSNYLYLMANVYSSRSTFNEIKSEPYNLPLIVSPIIEKYFPITKVKEFEVTDFAKPSLEEASLYSDLFSHDNINRIFVLVESATELELGTMSTFDLLNNFLILLKHGLHENSKGLKNNFVTCSIDKLAKLFKIGDSIGDQASSFVFNQVLDVLSESKFDTKAMDLNIISMKPEVLRIFMRLILHNSSDRQVYELIWSNFVKSLEKDDITQTSFEVCLFLIFCFETLNIETRKQILSSLLSQLVKEDFLKGYRKTLLANVLSLFEYLCFNFEKIPSSAIQQLTSFIKGEKVSGSKNLLLQQLDSKDVDSSIFELNCPTNEFCTKVLEMLSKDDTAEKLTCKLLEALSICEDKNSSHECDYFTDVSLRLIKSFMKIETLKFGNKTYTDILADIFYQTKKSTTNYSSIFEKVTNEKNIETIKEPILLSMYTDRTCMMLRKHLEQNLSDKSLVPTLYTSFALLKALLTSLYLVFDKELRNNKLSNEEVSVCLDICQSSIGKENIVSLLGTFTSPNLAKISTLNVGEWYDSKLQSLKKIASELLLEESFGPILIHTVKGAHLSRENSAAFSLYHSMKLVVDLISFTINKATETNLFNLSLISSDMIEILLNIREHYAFRSGLLVESILFNIFKSGFVQELNIFKNFTVLKVIDSVKRNTLIEKKEGVAKKVLSETLETLEDQIFSSDEKKLQSIQTLLTGEPLCPQYCEKFRFNSSVLMSLLMQTQNSTDIFNLLLSFIESILTKVDPENKQISKMLSETEGFYAFIESKILVKETRKQIEQLIKCLSGKENTKQILDNIVDAMLKVLNDCASSNSGSFEDLSKDLFPMVISINRGDQLVHSLLNILDGQFTKTDIHIIEPICTFLSKNMEHDLDPKRYESNHAILKYLKEIANPGEVFKFNGPVVQSNSEIEENMENCSYITTHSLIKNNGFSVDLENTLDIPETKNFSENKSSFHIGDALIEKLVSILTGLKQEYEKQTTESESKNLTWCLEGDFSVSKSQHTLAEKAASFAVSSFTANVTFERRQEATIFRTKPMSRHLLASNLSNTMAISEQSDISFMRNTTNFADSMKKDNTRSDAVILNTHSVPFKVVHIKFNPENDNFLAVAGIYECHVLVLDSDCNVTQQIPLYLACEDMPNETYIIDIQWLPGEQCLLSVTTNQFVKVYDLSSDTFCPTFNFSAQNDSIAHSVFASDPNGMKCLKTCFALTKKGNLFYQSYFNSGGEAMFSDGITIALHNGSEGKHVFYSELTHMLFVSYADGTSVALQLDHLSGTVLSCLELSKDPIIKPLGFFTHLIDIIDVCGALAIMTSNYKLVLFNFLKDKVEFQILDTPESQTIQGLTSIPPFSKNSSIVGLFSSGELIKYSLTKEIVPCLSLPPKSRIFKELRKRHGCNTVKRVKHKIPASVAEKPLDLDSVPIDTENSEDITSKCTFEGEKINSIGLDTFNNSIDENNDLFIQGHNLKFKVKKSDEYIFTHIKVLLGKSNKISIPSSVFMAGHTVETELNTEKWYSIPLTNQEALELSELEVELSAAHDGLTETILDSIKIFGTSSSAFRFKYSKKKLESKKVEETSVQVEEKLTFSSEDISTIYFLNRTISNYFQKNVLDTKLSKSQIFSLIAECLMIPKLDELKEFLVSTMVSLCDEPKSFITTKTAVELKYISKKKLKEMDASKADIVISKYLEAIELDNDQVFNQIKSNTEFKETIYSLIDKNSLDGNLNHDNLVRLYSSILFMEFVKESGSLDKVSKFLMDDDESVRTSCSTSLASLLTFSSITNEKVFTFTTFLIGLTEKTHESLSLLNILQLISVSVLKYCSNLNENEYETSIPTFMSSLPFNFSDLLNNLSMKSPASEKRILTLAMLVSLVSASSENFKFVPSLKKSICSLLTQTVPELHGNMISVGEDMLALFVPGNQADFEDIMGGLLKSQKEIPTRLFSPIFSLAFLEENKSDMFASYPKIVLQVVLRLFNHMHEVSPVEEPHKSKWSNFFSNIALDDSSFVSSIGKHYLLKICGSSEVYNKLMDEKLFKSKLSDFINGSDPVSVWSPEKARRLVVKVNDIMDNVNIRPENWIEFCTTHENVLPSLFEFSFLLDESVTIPLLLLNLSFKSGSQATLQKLSSLLTIHSVKTMNKFVDFIFNGETNTIRSEAAGLMSKLVQNSVKYKEMLFNVIIKRVKSLPYYGKKGKEFLNNLLIPIYNHYPEKKQLITDELVKCLQSQNGLICNHPNSYIYDTIQQYITVEPSGYYLETTPCLVCSDPELDFEEINLQNVTQGQKQSHSSHYYKLSNSYTIESLSIDISDFKRSKMIRTVEVYFNNNQALDASDLPKNSTVWQRAGTMNVGKAEQSSKLTFSVPVTCCNLLVEFSSFYFDLASMDALFCDACGIAVYDKYGLCLSCGENVFSCSNCRGINYDNLDAFICSTCGTCKFATFSFTLSGKQVFIGDKIRNEDDCKKSLQIIDNQLNSSESKLSALKSKSSEIKSLLVKLKTGDYGDENLSQVITSLQDVYNNQTKTLHAGLSHCQKLMLTTRKHLREYISTNRQSDKKYYQESSSTQTSNQFDNKCYGCANNFVSNVMDFFLKVDDNKGVNFSDNLVEELFKNISRGGLKEKSFKLLTSLSFGNEQVSDKVNIKLKELIVKFCKKTLKGYDVTSQLVALTELLKRITFDEKDPYFNNRIQLLFEVLLETSTFSSSVIICEEMIKPCLVILQKFISYGNTKQQPADQVSDQTVVPMRGLHFGYNQVKEGEMSFEMFKNNQIPKKLPRNDFDILGREFLSNTLLNLCSNTVRELTLEILQSLCSNNTHKQIGILQALTALLSEAMKRGEVSSCFFKLFNELVYQEERKTLLSSKGFLSFVCKLLKKEVSYIHKLENSNTNQSQDLSTGSSLYFLVSLLSEFLNIPEILSEFKTTEQHISTVLGSFLSLKSLVVQKTKATTDSYEMLKALTEKLQDTEDDKKLFIAACVDTLKMYSDNRTALFVFEKLNNIIQPIKEEPVFTLKLTRAASQEFYFQGRLSRQTWNSYDFKNSSGGVALMSDVKDKICEELSIHSDIPFELLVNNKIIALTLPITRVYEKVWLTRNMENSTPNAPMEVVYRFQGIDEASEDNVDTLPSDDDSLNIAQRCKITGIISKYGGIEVMVSYLRSITDFSSDKSLAKNLLQFMQYCTNVKLNRRRFLMTDTVECLLSKCKYVFQHGDLAEIAELLLLVIRPLIKEATKMSHETPASPLSSPLSPISVDIFNVDSSDMSPMSPNIIGKSDKYKISNEEILEQLKMFLERLPVCSSKIVTAVQSILPFLTYGLEEPMDYLIQYFESYLKFETFENTTKQKFYLDSFVNVVSSIPNDFAGNNLKTQILNRGITKLALNFVLDHFNESKDWKSSLSLPALPYALNLLQGLVTFHSPTHTLLNSEPLFRILHKIEENTEEKMIATYSESLLNSIAEGSSQSKSIISNIRKSTKEEKKKKAMSKREKTLKQLKQPKITFNFDEIEEDKGILCSVCGDGNSFSPEQVLGTYVFCKHCYLSDNSSAISSVTQFNTIHSSCHTVAVTSDQNRNPPKTEWEGAQIRNSFTKCNALFPFKGPKTSAANYSNAVQKYFADLALVKNTGRESFDLLSHDLMLLLNKFAREESFSKDSGGGSSIHQVKLIPFMIQMGLYLLDTMNNNRETQETLLTSFLSTDMETTLELENISYNAILSLYLMTLEEWNHYKKIVIKRVVSTIKNTTNGSEEEKFNALRPALIFVTLIDAFQNHLKSPSGLAIKDSIKHASTEEWIVKLSKKLESIDQDELIHLEDIATLYSTQLLKFTTVKQFEQVINK